MICVIVTILNVSGNPHMKLRQAKFLSFNIEHMSYSFEMSENASSPFGHWNNFAWKHPTQWTRSVSTIAPFAVFLSKHEDARCVGIYTTDVSEIITLFCALRWMLVLVLMWDGRSDCEPFSLYQDESKNFERKMSRRKCSEAENKEIRRNKIIKSV